MRTELPSAAGRGRAVFFQQTRGSDNELAVVRAAARRDALVDDIERLHLQSRRLGAVEDEVWTRLLRLVVCLRTATLEVLRAVSFWQHQFTRPRDFVLSGKDYVLTMVTRTDFLASLKLRHRFGFEIRRGNVFVLPLSTAKNSQVDCVDEVLSEAVKAWSQPDEEELREAYRLLRHLLPAAAFGRVLSLGDWMENRWTISMSKSSKLRKIKPCSRRRKESMDTEGFIEVEAPLKSKPTFTFTTESLRLEYSRYLNPINEF